MIKLDSILLEKILNKPRYDLDVSPAAWGHLAGFMSGHLGLDPTKENMKLSVTLVRALLYVGYEWGTQSAIDEIESIGKGK